MSESAHVESIEALREFEGALLNFYESAVRATTNMQQQAHRLLQWLELDRPGFWKRQTEVGHQRLAEARTRLTQCKMRRVGDFRPSCYDEKKALMRAKRELEFAEQQIKVVKQWALKSRHEFEEFNGRMSQLTRLLEGDVPRMCALLQRLSRTLERYTHVSTAEAMSLVATAIDEDAAEPAGNEPEHGESS